MERSESNKRIAWFVTALFAVMAVSFVGYNLSPSFGALHQPFAAILGTTFFLSVAVGPALAYTYAAARGAPFRLCLLAAAVNPFFWMTKEVIRLTESHPLIECLYWYFNPLSFWLVAFLGFELGVGTMVGKLIRKRRGETIRVVTLPAVTVVGVSLTVVISAYAWGRGENIYVIFLAGYRLLFGSGLS